MDQDWLAIELRIRIEMIFEKLGCDEYELAKRHRAYDEEINKLKQFGQMR